MTNQTIETQATNGTVTAPIVPAPLATQTTTQTTSVQSSILELANEVRREIQDQSATTQKLLNNALSGFQRLDSMAAQLTNKPVGMSVRTKVAIGATAGLVVGVVAVKAYDHFRGGSSDVKKPGTPR